MEEKQLKGNLNEIVRSLHAKFEAENAKDATKEHAQPREILMLRGKRERKDEQDDLERLIRTIQGLTFSMKDPRPKGWTGDNPLIIQGPSGT